MKSGSVSPLAQRVEVATVSGGALVEPSVPASLQSKGHGPVLIAKGPIGRGVVSWRTTFAINQRAHRGHA